MSNDKRVHIPARLRREKPVTCRMIDRKSRGSQRAADAMIRVHLPDWTGTYDPSAPENVRARGVDGMCTSSKYTLNTGGVRDAITNAKSLQHVANVHA